ncbi:hypothetical protein [Vulgatibacter sp.]|uniref:hypothetical protein n=1 Tax=Vulgatibacter sp. TaxID=1971226 RepID=UPI00356595C2
MSDGSPTVLRGRILCYRIFDVGDQIDLDRAEQTLIETPGKKRAKLSREGAESLAFTSPPLDVGLGKRSLALPKVARTIECDVAARFFDFAAISVLFEVPIPPGTRLSEMLPLCDELYDTPVLEQHARLELDPLLDRLRSTIEGTHAWPGVETYTVIFVEELEGSPSAREVLATPGLGKLLLGETSPKRLASEERGDVLKHAYSYFDDDLAVIDWNSAFVLEPSGSRDIPDILEFATSQLLELRYYDDLLDVELNGIYDEVEEAGGRWWALFWSPYGALARKVMRQLLEVTEFTERVENSLKVIGDFYLARVYRAAVRRFRLPSWQESVGRKQTLVAQVYALLKGEIDMRRNTLLEAAIVLLIVFDIVMAFWPGAK